MIRCAAFGCGNDETSGVSLFPFPKKPKLKRKWEASIGRNDLSPSSAICEVHFADDDLAIRDGTKFMKAEAVPTMFGSQSSPDDSDLAVRRSSRTRQAANKRIGLRRTTPSKLVEKKKLASSAEKRKTKHDNKETQVDDDEQTAREPELQADQPIKFTAKKRKPRRKEIASSAESQDNRRKLRLVLDGADERGHAIAEWYLLDVFEATRMITTNLLSGTLITDHLVANVEETVIEVINKLLQRVSSVIITSIEEEFGVRSDIRKILGKLDGDVADAVKLLLEEDKEEINQPKPVPNVVDYEETLHQLDPLRYDYDVIEEVISPATEECQVMLEHSYFKDIEDKQNKGKRKQDKSEQELQCGFCEFKTFWKIKLRRHLRIKHLGGERSYSCPRCAYVAPSEEGLQKHFRTHTGVKPFACSQCDFCTANKSNLNRHMLIHTGEKPFECIHCNKTFRQKVSLAAHIKSHVRRISDENPREKNVYVCGECTFVTIVRTEWLEHTKIHKEYKCGHCEFVSPTYAELKEHQVVHNGLPHVCGICKHRCHNADELRIHIETHKTGPDIVCNLCGYRTTKKSYLNRHVASHMGDKPYKCDYCQAKFRTTGQLNLHVRRHEIGPFCKR